VLTDAIRHSAEATDEPVREGLADVHFFRVMLADDANREEFVDALMKALAGAGIGEYANVDADRLRKGPGYIELGAWIGSQDMALRMMGLCKLWGLCDLITPATLGVTGDNAEKLAGSGMVMLVLTDLGAQELAPELARD